MTNIVWINNSLRKLHLTKENSSSICYPVIIDAEFKGPSKGPWPGKQASNLHHGTDPLCLERAGCCRDFYLGIDLQNILFSIWSLSRVDLGTSEIIFYPKNAIQRGKREKERSRRGLLSNCDPI